MQLIFEKSQENRRGIKIPKNDTGFNKELPKNLLREDTNLPELSELDVIRHYTNLSKLNFSIDSNFYPLGSCTMKYNPKICEKTASLKGFIKSHPNSIYSSQSEDIQGSLELLDRLSFNLKEILGMDHISLTPQAGAHGEMSGLMIVAKYHQKKNNKKKYIIIPDSAHGTNPATATMVGYDVIVIKSSKEGLMDLDEFKAKMSDEVAGVMLTCPNTLGIFNPYIKEICDIAHKYDALMYYDGANLNAILGRVRPGDIGFDIVHVNLHKTFSTPHGGGGPGAGPIGVRGSLKEFLPSLRVEKEKDKLKVIEDKKDSIGRVSPYFGNFGILLRAYTYMTVLGKEGMLDVSEKAVLNANYIRVKLSKYYDIAYDKMCMHECVFSLIKEAKNGVRAMDISKFLIDNDLHPTNSLFSFNS